MSRISTGALRSGVLTVFALLVAFGWFPHALTSVSAAGPPDVVTGLLNSDAYISPIAVKARLAHSSDLGSLQTAAQQGAGEGVPEKLAIIDTYPRNIYRTTEAAADYVRNILNFSGTLVLASRYGIGVSSDTLSASERVGIERAARPKCITSFPACVVFAAHEAAAKVKSDKSSTNRSAAIFWLVILGLIGLVILFFVSRVLRRRRKQASRASDLRTAAGNTLSIADNAVSEIENSGLAMSPPIRAEYDRALGLRDRARNETEKAGTDAMLSQANQDSAQAVLALQGVMRQLGMQTALTSPMDVPEHRCFYCGRTDRPPYTSEALSDGKGNEMTIEVCTVDGQRLASGRKPEVATVNYGGSMVPWWAVPGNPWYYGYGGPSWQYWLPFMVGMDAGAWFGGGWGNYGYDSDWNDGDGNYGNYGGDVGANAGGDASTDPGAGDFGWGDNSGSGWDSGGTDSGGWGSGGDSGGWDSGGGDFGGGGDGGGGDGGWS